MSDHEREGRLAFSRSHLESTTMLALGPAEQQQQQSSRAASAAEQQQQSSNSSRAAKMSDKTNTARMRELQALRAQIELQETVVAALADVVCNVYASFDALKRESTQLHAGKGSRPFAPESAASLRVRQVQVAKQLKEATAAYFNELGLESDLIRVYDEVSSGKRAPPRESEMKFHISHQKSSRDHHDADDFCVRSLVIDRETAIAKARVDRREAERLARFKAPRAKIMK
jgi:hypothetical protein